MANPVLQLRDYRLTTAEILFTICPTIPALLQTFLWQEYDLAPISPSCAGSSISGSGRSTASCIPCASRIKADCGQDLRHYREDYLVH